MNKRIQKRAYCPGIKILLIISAWNMEFSQENIKKKWKDVQSTNMIQVIYVFYQNFNFSNEGKVLA